MIDGYWTKAAAPAIAGHDDDPHHLVDAINLRRSFRKIAVAHLQRLRKNGKLQLDDWLAHLRCDDAWDAMTEQVEYEGGFVSGELSSFALGC